MFFYLLYATHDLYIHKAVVYNILIYVQVKFELYDK